MLSSCEYEPNREYWNIVKGLGILLVVAGHACSFLVDYVYIFHLQLFFFVSGFLFSEKKYAMKPALLIRRRFTSLWLRYVVISLVLVLLHNVLFDLGMQRLDAHRYSFKELLINIFYCLLGNSKELLGGTLWFLPVLFFVIVILELIVFISIKLKHTWIKLICQGVCVFAITFLGYYLISQDYHLVADIQVSFAVLIYAWLGYLIRNYLDIKRILNIKWIYAVLIVTMAAGFVYVYYYSTRHWVDLIFGSVTATMYIPAVVGIYSALVLSLIISKIPYLGRFTGYMGSISLIVMIVHYPVLKIIDKIICLYIGDPDKTIYDKIPVSFPNIWPVYILVSIAVSIAVALLIDKIKKSVRKEKRNV